MLPDLIILDLDGTVYRGQEPTPGAIETLAELRRRGVRLRFLTNNSALSGTDVEQKLARLGFEVHPGEGWSSATGAALRLQADGVQHAFVIGEPGLVQVLEGAGVRVVNASPSGRVVDLQSPDPKVQAVVSGICLTFSYNLLNSALQHLRLGARFIATNTDSTYPLEGGKVIPGSGALVAGLQTCSGLKPEVIGKPEPFLIEAILSQTEVAPERALVVGDRVETDIEAGRRAGVPSHLVLCGITPEPVPGIPSSPDLRGLLELS